MRQERKRIKSEEKELLSYIPNSEMWLSPTVSKQFVNSCGVLRKCGLEVGERRLHV